MHRHHKQALLAVGAAVASDAVLGACFGAADHVGIPDGLWFTTVTATTVGYGDVTPHGWLPHLIAVLTMVIVIPLVAAAFSLLTSGLVAGHISAQERPTREPED